MTTARRQYVADLSLALVNRTGAYHVCSDIVRGCPQFFSGVRYWQFTLKTEPHGVVRKLLARAMLFDLAHSRIGLLRSRLGLARERAAPTVFLDPLYVLNTELRADDIVLCHDVGPVTHPALFDAGTVAMYERAYKKIQAVGPGVVCVSVATRAAFMTTYGNRLRFVETIPLYVREAMASGAEDRPDTVSGRFLLTVAATEARKNYEASIAAFARSGLGERGYTYVICGPRGNAERAVRAAAEATPNVLRLGFVPDAQLRWLYGHAAGFVLPSLLEGFGIPALEASQHGLVSIVSAGGAQEEAVGDGGLLVDPENLESIAHAMTQLVDMPAAEREKRLAQCAAHATVLSRQQFLARWTSLLERG